MKFTKMQGLGNDYLYIFSNEEPKNPSELSIKLSDRHFGAGSDGIIYILPSTAADYKMRIFNADGSEALMCGNGIRCVGKYLFDKGYINKNEVKIETLSGIKKLELKIDNKKVKSVTVNMGKSEPQKDVVLNVLNKDYTVKPVSMGNPHAVIFVNDAENAPLTTVGPKIEHHSFFKNGTNVEFIKVLDKNKLRMRVWERGSGITLACGTGACASAMAAIENGFCEYNSDISVVLDGGTLHIKILNDNTVLMTGPAEFVYEGEVADD